MSKQPFRAVLDRHNISQRAAAEAVGVSEHYFSQVALGHQKASARFRRALAELLNEPEETLFTLGQPSDDARRLVERTTQAQGLTLTITDPAIIAKVAAVLATGMKRGAA